MTIDEITKHSEVMKKLNKINPDALEYFNEAKDLIQKYTGSLKNHDKREELLCIRYELAKQLALYKSIVLG